MRGSVLKQISLDLLEPDLLQNLVFFYVLNNINTLFQSIYKRCSCRSESLRQINLFSVFFGGRTSQQKWLFRNSRVKFLALMTPQHVQILFCKTMYLSIKLNDLKCFSCSPEFFHGWPPNLFRNSKQAGKLNGDLFSLLIMDSFALTNYVCNDVSKTTILNPENRKIYTPIKISESRLVIACPRSEVGLNKRYAIGHKRWLLTTRQSVNWACKTENFLLGFWPNCLVAPYNVRAYSILKYI